MLGMSTWHHPTISPTSTRTLARVSDIQAPTFRTECRPNLCLNVFFPSHSGPLCYITSKMFVEITGIESGKRTEQSTKTYAVDSSIRRWTWKGDHVWVEIIYTGYSYVCTTAVRPQPHPFRWFHVGGNCGVILRFGVQHPKSRGSQLKFAFYFFILLFSLLFFSSFTFEIGFLQAKIKGHVG